MNGRTTTRMQLVQCAAAMISTIVVCAFAFCSEAVAIDLLAAVMEDHRGQKTMHHQKSDDCMKLLAEFKKAKADNVKMQLTFSDPPFSGYVVELNCIKPDGTIVKHDGIAQSLTPGTKSDNSRIWGVLFRQKLELCWKKPSNAFEGIEVGFDIKLSRDGMFLEPPKAKPPATTAASRSYQESALRALTDCQPYKLPLENYEEWKSFTPVFSERRATEAASPKAATEAGKLDVKTIKTTRIAPPSSVEERTYAGEATPKVLPEIGKPDVKAVEAPRPQTKVLKNFKCSGEVGNYFAGIADHSIGSGDSMCYFVSQSDIGRRILKECILGSNCQVVGTVINDQDAGDWSPIITDVIKIVQIPKGVGKLPYGSRGGAEVTVTSRSGLDSENAVIKARMTREDAEAYCEAEDRSKQCLSKMAKHAQTLKPDVRANCKTKEFTDFSGSRFASYAGF